MKLREKNIRDLMLLLLDTEEALSSEEISRRLQVSTKTVRNYLKIAEERFAAEQVALVKKPHVGNFIVADELVRASLRRKQYSVPAAEYTEGYRQNYIRRILLQNSGNYTIQLLADDLECSKNTILKDLRAVEGWLLKHQLKLVRRQNAGLSLEGRENDLRNAMMDLIAHHVPQASDELNFDLLSELDYRVDIKNYQKMKRFFPKIDFLAIQTIIQEAERRLGYYFTDQAFINLIAHIEITLVRLHSQHHVVGKKIYDMFVKKEKEYTTAKWVVEELQRKFRVSIPEDEAAYICLHMLGAKIQNNVSNAGDCQQIIDSQSEQYLDFAREIIAAVGNIIGRDLSTDGILLAGLVSHLRPTVIRLKYGLHLHNPLLDRIKEEFLTIFGAAWIANSIFEKRIGVSINEDEVGYITLHIAAAVDRTAHELKALVVCSSGVGTSQIIANRLVKAFPEVKVGGIVPLPYLTSQMVEENDLIVTTVPCRMQSSKIVYVSTFFDDRDISLVQKCLEKRIVSPPAARELGDIKGADQETRFAEIISPDFCFFDEGEKPYLEIIKKYVSRMEKEGFVHFKFYDNLVRREQKASTVIGRGIAIPHAKDDFVLRPKICIVKLAKPVLWDGQKIELIFILALKFADGQSTRTFFRHFYALLDEDACIERMKQCRHPAQLAACFC